MNHAAVLPYLTRFERVLVRSYLPYLAFIDALDVTRPSVD